VAEKVAARDATSVEESSEVFDEAEEGERRCLARMGRVAVSAKIRRKDPDSRTPLSEHGHLGQEIVAVTRQAMQKHEHLSGSRDLVVCDLDVAERDLAHAR
jgi:hypothetical protein